MENVNRGTDDYLEIFFEMARVIIMHDEDSDVMNDIGPIGNAVKTYGYSGLYMLAIQWADEFITEFNIKLNESGDEDDNIVYVSDFNDQISDFISKKYSEHIISKIWK